MLVGRRSRRTLPVERSAVLGGLLGGLLGLLGHLLLGPGDLLGGLLLVGRRGRQLTNVLVLLAAAAAE